MSFLGRGSADPLGKLFFLRIQVSVYSYTTTCTLVNLSNKGHVAKHMDTEQSVRLCSQSGFETGIIESCY